ncbi:tripartite tricarboxylate transporter substrate binding protein [Ottowia sp.]|uniref:Bug family tripartite tricarboxylate transporter substrate binding protein n=1 Tax=Ottowia sp. TaxID=1898956 RepID=UPI001D9CF7A6|nr:tripartite tricarboxylate transporter substrate binding protein [Ottowia sp.]MCP5258284.1 tripartite tricarboxylate transporter substrate binding protein [Burkholderiaceae bacterium]MCB2025023.1 tripartite tricarboxylate transporter substrate binding protein [Ottowia sp.]MCB2034118.1 tripartite tricarboxylate transporter substrate binding protein [Ottowia sp.]HPR44634.1 tripartite tricarboxylate transporter substrate binding protein [Ottowia sp.]HRW71382.1 tripartite tricarboxylate transpor
MRRRSFLLWAPLTALAAEFPSAPVKLIHAYPGGLVDNGARALATPLSVRWHQPVVVEPRPGANELLASEAVARSAKDGSTLLVATKTVMANNLFLFDKLRFDPWKELVPIRELFRIQFALVVRAELPVTSLTDFVALMKKEGARHNYGSSGTGGPLHLAMEGFRRRAGFEIEHVPYKTIAQVAQDLLGGHVDAVFISAPFALPFVQSGKLKMLAVTGPERLRIAPKVPTFAESGYPGTDDSTSVGLLARHGTPAPVLASIGRDAAAVLRSDEFRQTFLAPNGLEASDADAAQYAASLQARRGTVQQLFKQLGIQPQ